MTPDQCTVLSILIMTLVGFISGYRARGDDPAIWEYNLLLTRIKQLKKQLADKKRDKRGRFA